jgi:hypothetical protein
VRTSESSVAKLVAAALARICTSSSEVVVSSEDCRRVSVAILDPTALAADAVMESSALAPTSVLTEPSVLAVATFASERKAEVPVDSTAIPTFSVAVEALTPIGVCAFDTETADASRDEATSFDPSALLAEGVLAEKSIENAVD